MLLLALLLAILPARPTTCVYDPGHVISPADTQALILACNTYDRLGAAAIVVAVVNDLAGMSRPEFANALFKAWGIGHHGRDDGLLILLALPPADRGIKVEVGYGLEGVLPDGKTMSYVRLQMPNLKAGNYGQALKSLMAAYGEASLPEAKPRPKPAQTDESTYVLVGLGVLILFFAFIAWVAWYAFSKRKPKPEPYLRQFTTPRDAVVPSGRVLTVEEERYIQDPPPRYARRTIIEPTPDPIVIVNTPPAYDPPAPSHHHSDPSPSYSSPSPDYGSSSSGSSDSGSFGGFDSGSSGGGGGDSSF